MASNVSVAWQNRATAAVLTASSAFTAMPITLLQQQDTRRTWRGAAGAGVLESIYFDLLSTVAIDTVSLMFTNLAAGDATRLRLSVADPTCATNTFDSTSIAGRIDPSYYDLHFLATPASNPRYGRIDLTRAAGSAEAGFLFAGTRTQFTYNRDIGDQRTVVDPSIIRKTDGGQTNFISKPKFRRWEFNIGLLTQAQRWSVVEAIDLSSGITSPVLFFMDPSSANLGRDTIFGLLTETSPVASITGFDNATGNPVYSRSYKIDERL
jgi:hypothetical protein